MSDSNGSHPSESSAPAQPRHSQIRLLPIDPAAIPALASLGYQSFYDFSISVAQPPEFQSVQAYHDTLLAELDKEETFHLMAVREEGVDKSSPYHVEGVGEVLGSVLMDCSAEVAAIGPISVSSSRQKVGVGRQLMRACLVEADRRRFRSVRLCNIAANPTAFSLYHSLGFRAVEYMMHCKGFIDPSHDSVITSQLQRDGVTIRPMTSSDLPLCDRLHTSTNSFSRINSLIYAYNAQRANRPANEHEKPDPTEPLHTCFVAVNTAGEIVGYNDGHDVDSHWIGESEEVVVGLYHRVGMELRGVGGSLPDVLVLTRQSGELLARLVRLGVRAVRQVCLMNRGQYVEPHRNIYCPSIMW